VECNPNYDSSAFLQMISCSTRTDRQPSAVTSSVQDRPVVSPDRKRKRQMNPDDERTTQRATRKLSSEETDSNGDERKADTATMPPLKEQNESGCNSEIEAQSVVRRLDFAEADAEERKPAAVKTAAVADDVL
jgi:hypothetical protein